MHSSRFLICVPLLALAGITLAADPGPASGPAASTSTPASAPASISATDFSTPTATVKSYLQASFNQLDLAKPQDDAAVANTLSISARDKDAVEAILNLTSASAKLERACSDVFGAAATSKQLGSSATDLLVSRLKSIDAAPVKIDGDKATIQIPADPSAHSAAGTVKLEDQSGQWKIDAASLYSLDSKTPAQIAQQKALVEKLADISNAVASEVRDGKYPSVKDAYIAFETRAADALPGPATAPAAPATAPGAGQADPGASR